MTEHDPLIEELARAIFRCNFAADEDETTVAEKWIEWASSQRKAIMTATAIRPIIERARIAGAKAGLEAAARVARKLNRIDQLGEYYRGNDVAKALEDLDHAAIAGAGEG